MNIYIGNMSYDATESDLKSAFEDYGQVQSATIIKDKYTGTSKGFGFVEMPNKKEGEAAIEGLHNKELSGRTITVNEARLREENRGGGGRGGFSGGRGGGGHKGGGFDGRQGNGPGRGGFRGEERGGFSGGGRGGGRGGQGGRNR